MNEQSKPQPTPPTSELKSEYRLDYTNAKPNRFANLPRTQPVDVGSVADDAETNAKAPDTASSHSGSTAHPSPRHRPITPSGSRPHTTKSEQS